MTDDYFLLGGPKGARLFHGGRYRTLLWRQLPGEAGSEKRPLGVLMKNPSVADHKRDDATIRVLLRVARDAGASGILVANLVPYVATNPSDMLRWLHAPHRDEDKQIRCAMCHENTQAVAAVLSWCPRVLVAWGRADDLGSGFCGVMQYVRDKLATYRGQIVCLGHNIDGSPHHPLRCKLAGGLVAWKPSS